MEYELKEPLSVYVKGEDKGEYQEHKLVIVSFVGRKGLKSLKRIQDIIYKAITDSANSIDTGKQKEKKEEVALKLEDVFDLLEMTGNSEKLFDAVCGTMQAHATIAGVKLNDNLQEDMDVDDLDGLYKEVLNHFLLPKVCQKMNSMKK